MQPAARPGHSPHAAAHAAVETAIAPCTGWHCSHLFYAFDRGRLAALSPAALAAGVTRFAEVLDPAGPDAATRLQTWIVPGHKADFGVMVLDPDPLKVDSVHQRLLASPLGEALV
jgi:chlorite dismutase